MAFTLESYALTQVNDVKSIIDIASTTTTWDQTFIELINGATVWMENYCGRTRFGHTTLPVYTDETYDSFFAPTDDGKQYWLYVRNWPVVTWTTIAYRSGTSTYTTFDSTSYETYDDEGGIYFYGAMPRGKKIVRLTYSAGYTINWTTQSSHTLPHDLTYACRKIVLAAFNKRKSLGIKNESIGSWSVGYDEIVAADEEVKNILSTYKRKNV